MDPAELSRSVVERSSTLGAAAVSSRGDAFFADKLFQVKGRGDGSSVPFQIFSDILFPYAEEGGGGGGGRALFSFHLYFDIIFFLF